RRADPGVTGGCRCRECTAGTEIEGRDLFRYPPQLSPARTGGFVVDPDIGDRSRDPVPLVHGDRAEHLMIGQWARWEVPDPGGEHECPSTNDQGIDTVGGAGNPSDG